MTWTLMFKCPSCGFYLYLTKNISFVVSYGCKCPRCNVKISLNPDTNEGEISKNPEKCACNA